MKIAILYMCTGKYDLFWNNFYLSCEKFFLKKHDKYYFIFTDKAFIDENNPHICLRYQKNIGWPYITLMRYNIFTKISSMLSSYDYCFFFNANSEFCYPIEDDFLPNGDSMLFVQHPGYFDKMRDTFPYEDNILSKAYIAKNEGNTYVCGGISGGKSKTYIHFMKTISKYVNIDLKNGIVAKWHDESYSNRYVIDNNCTIKNPGYCYPQGQWLPFTPKIRIRDKAMLGGHDYLRGISNIPSMQTDSKIVIELKGGLGNQMFQYALGRALSLSHMAPLLLDLSWYTNVSNETSRMFMLSKFPALSEGRNLWSECSSKEKFDIYRSYMKKKSNNRQQKIQNPHFKEPSHINYCENVEKIVPPFYVSGYWQNEKYFLHCKDYILDDFRFPMLNKKALILSDKIKNSTNSLSIHVRRGDYLSNTRINAVHGLCTEDYYNASINYIKKMHHDITLFLFSDDPDWVKKKFNMQCLPHVIVDLHNEDEAVHDMHLMSLCRHHIIANSSFSWWGAWLSGEHGITIAPKKWFANEQYIIKDPSPERWVRM